MERPLFSLKKVDERTWGHVRAASVLDYIFSPAAATRAVASAVSGVTQCSGHVCVSLALSRATQPPGAGARPVSSIVLCFDSAPLSRHLADDDVVMLRQFVATGAAERSGFLARMLVSVHTAPVVATAFVPASPGSGLRLCAIDTSGALFVWEWIAEDWLWVAVGTVPLIQRDASASVDQQLAICWDSPRSAFVWAESGAVWSKPVAIEARPNPKMPGRKNMTFVITAGQQQRLADLPGDRSVAAADGIWTVSAEEVRMFSLRSQSVLSASLRTAPIKQTPAETSTTASAASPEVATTFYPVATCVHSLTGELVLLDAAGRLVSCTPADGGSVALSLLCRLDERNPAPACIAFAVTRHSACLLTTTQCHFYDLLSGVRMGEVDLPGATPARGRFWGPSPGDAAGQFGVWWPAALLQVVQPSPTLYAEALMAVASGKDCPPDADDGSEQVLRRDAAALSVISVCADWGLDQWVAQHAFDLLLRGIPHYHVEDVARALSARLQNPALVVALLSARNMSGFIEDEISRFISTFTCSVSSDSRDAKRAAARAAYQAYTPLNTKVYPDLLRYLQLLRSQEQGGRALLSSSPPSSSSSSSSSPFLPSSPPLYLSEVPPKATLSLDWHTLWAMSSENSLLFCEKIFAVVGVRMADLEKYKQAIAAGKEAEPRRLHGVLLQPEQHVSSREVPPKSETTRLAGLFELVCIAMFACLPGLLPAFVKMVSRSADVAASSSPQSPQPAIGTARHKGFPERALSAIPFTEGNSAPEQSVAIAGVLVLAKLPLSALLLLLRAGLWPDALRLIEESSVNADIRIHSAELFSIALHDCMRSKDVGKLSQLLSRAHLHPCLTALDLVQAISGYVAPSAEVLSATAPPQCVTVTQGSGHLAVGLFKESLLAIVRSTPQPPATPKVK